MSHKTPGLAPSFALKISEVSRVFGHLWSLYGETNRQTVHGAGPEVPMAAYAAARPGATPCHASPAMPCQRALGVFASLSQTFQQRQIFLLKGATHLVKIPHLVWTVQFWKKFRGLGIF
eukprot:s2445_g2.t1